MNLLLDTHVLLWWLDDNPTLSSKAKAAIADPKNIVFVSAAVIWEIQIKQALGKLQIPEDFHSVLDHQPFEMLSITAEHAYMVGDLPLFHQDPFDRMLIAQAKVEHVMFVTRDNKLKEYDIPLIAA